MPQELCAAEFKAQDRGLRLNFPPNLLCLSPFSWVLPPSLLLPFYTFLLFCPPNSSLLSSCLFVWYFLHPPPLSSSSLLPFSLFSSPFFSPSLVSSPFLPPPLISSYFLCPPPSSFFPPLHFFHLLSPHLTLSMLFTFKTQRCDSSLWP